MNSSLFTADRSTHIKIVVTALAAAIVVVVVSINARTSDIGLATARTWSDGPVVKAGQPAKYSVQEKSAIR